jgi:hypothetical protein
VPSHLLEWARSIRVLRVRGKSWALKLRVEPESIHVHRSTRRVVSRVADALVVSSQPRIFVDTKTVKPFKYIFRFVRQGTISNEERDTPCL